MNNIIDSPIELVKLKSDDLNELLLNPKYNKPNLKELCIRCIRMLNAYMEYADNLKMELDAYENKYNEIVKNLKELTK